MERGVARIRLVTRVLATSSRLYSKKINEFLNEFSVALPGVEKIVRGKRSYRALLEEAVIRGARYIMLVTSRRGNPASLEFLDVAGRRWLPYSIPISGVKMREDLQIYVARKPKACCAAIVDYTASELADVFLEVFGYPLFYSVDLEKIRGRYDTLVVIRGRPGSYLVELIDGRDLGPRGLAIKVKGIKIKYVRNIN
ncbi:MAG: Brix domain-containing protein [Thermoproteus sp.]